MSETIWDRIDFADTRVDFIYGALLPRLSNQRLLAIEIARAIPRSWWTTYDCVA